VRSSKASSFFKKMDPRFVYEVRFTDVECNVLKSRLFTSCKQQESMYTASRKRTAKDIKLYMWRVAKSMLIIVLIV